MGMIVYKHTRGVGRLRLSSKEERLLIDDVRAKTTSVSSCARHIWESVSPSPLYTRYLMLSVAINGTYFASLQLQTAVIGGILYGASYGVSRLDRVGPVDLSTSFPFGGEEEISLADVLSRALIAATSAWMLREAFNDIVPALFASSFAGIPVFLDFLWTSPRRRSRFELLVKTFLFPHLHIVLDKVREQKESLRLLLEEDIDVMFHEEGAERLCREDILSNMAEQLTGRVVDYAFDEVKRTIFTHAPYVSKTLLNRCFTTMQQNTEWIEEVVEDMTENAVARWLPEDLKDGQLDRREAKKWICGIGYDSLFAYITKSIETLIKDERKLLQMFDVFVSTAEDIDEKLCSAFGVSSCAS